MFTNMDYFRIFKRWLKLTEATKVWLMFTFTASKDQFNKWNRQEEYILAFSSCFQTAKLRNWLQKDTNNCLVIWQHPIKPLIRMNYHSKLKCKVTAFYFYHLRGKNLIFPPYILLDRHKSINPSFKKWFFCHKWKHAVTAVHIFTAEITGSTIGTLIFHCTKTCENKKQPSRYKS